MYYILISSCCASNSASNGGSIELIALVCRVLWGTHLQHPQKKHPVFTNCRNYPNIIAISETGLKAKIEDSTVALAGYELERHDSKTNKGGVALYIENELDYTVRKDFGVKVRRSKDLWVEIKPSKNKIKSEIRTSPL